jgi:hypothetical protein
MGDVRAAAGRTRDPSALVIENGVASAQLERCPDAMSGAPDTTGEEEPEPPVWRPGL